MQAYELNKDPRQDKIEVDLVKDKNTSCLKGGRPLSETILKEGVSDA